MTTDSSTTVLSALRQYELLTPAQLDETIKTLQSRFPEPKALVQELVRRGWLTAYQAEQLLNGNGQGLVLGPYRMLERVGSGNMGQVFRAHDVVMNRIVALKVINREYLSHPNAVKRFYREVQVVASLSHPNIVLGFHAGEIGEAHYLAMEFVDGTDLQSLVKAKGPLPVSEACAYIHQAALGLQHAHEHGVVHRDIKPSNLLLSVVRGPLPVAKDSAANDHGPRTADHGRIKILDFGLARFASDTGQKGHLTQLNKIVGTVDYMSPEQAENPREADIRSDIYSLGCTFFYLLTGRPPFTGEDMIERITARIVGDAPPVKALRPDVPIAVERVVAKMLTRKPAERFQTPAEVAAALEPLVKRSAPMQQAVALGVPAKTAPVASPSQAVKPQAAPAAAVKASAPPSRVVTQAAPARAFSAVVPTAAEKLAQRRRLLILAGIGGGLLLAAAAALAIVIAAINQGEPENRTANLGPSRPASPARPNPESRPASPLSTRPGSAAVTVPPIKPEAGPPKALRFKNRDYVELIDTRDLMDLNQSFTIEMWVRWQTTYRGVHHLAGDDAWPGVPKGAAVSQTSGWVLRTTALQNGQRGLDFSIGSRNSWLRVVGPARPETDDWQHIAVSKTPELISIYWNGEFYVSRPCKGEQFVPSVTDVYLGLRKGSLAVRHVYADIRAFRLSSSSRYQRDFAPQPRFQKEADTLVLLDFSIGRGARVRDLSGNGHDGTIEGAEWVDVADAAPAEPVPPDPPAPLIAEFRRFKGHTAPITGVGFSPDGRFAYSSGEDNVMRMWNVRTEKEIRKFEGHTHHVRGLAIAKDNIRALTAGYDSTIRMWDVDNGRELLKLEATGGGFISVAFSPDGNSAVSGGHDKIVRLWDLKSGKEVRRFEGHGGLVHAVAFSPDGATVVSAGYDKTVRLWDAKTGAEKHKLEGHAAEVTSVVFLPDGRRVLSGSEDKTLRLWDAETGNEIRTFEEKHEGAVRCLALSADGRRALSSGKDATVRLWNVETGREVFCIRLPEGNAIEGVAFSQDERQVVCGGADHSVYLIRLPDSGTPPVPPPIAKPMPPPVKPPEKPAPVFVDQETRRFEAKTGHRATVRGVGFSPDGKRAVSAAEDNTAILWDVETGKELRNFEGTAICFSADAKRILTVDKDGVVRVLDATTGKLVRQFESNARNVLHVAVTRDNRRAMITSSRGVQLLDLLTGQPLAGMEGLNGRISPDDTRALTVVLREGRGWLIQLHDLNTGRPVRQFGPGTPSLPGVAWSPNGSRALSRDGKDLVLWDVDTGKEVRRISGDSYGDVAVSPDGRLALSVGGALRMWNLQTGQELCRFAAPRAYVAAFSADGKQIVCGSADGAVHLWTVPDSLSGPAPPAPKPVPPPSKPVLSLDKETRRLQGHTKLVRDVEFSPDGKQALSADDDDVTILWDLETGKELRRLDGVRAAFSVDGRQILTGCKDLTARWWDARTGKELARMERHTSNLWAVAPLPDGRHALTSTAGNMMYLWDMLAGKQLRAMRGLSFALSPDGSRVLAIAHEKADGYVIRLYDLKTGNELRRFERGTANLYVAWSRDGSRALSGDKNDIVLWDANTGKELRRFQGHSGSVYALAFSPNGRRALSGGSDKTARLWDVETGQELCRFEGHINSVFSVAFSPDGKSILTGSVAVRLWTIPEAAATEQEKTLVAGFQLRNLKIEDAPPHRAGDILKIYWEMHKVGNDPGTTKDLGFGDTWIERLGDDPTIRAIPPKTPRDGNRYAAPRHRTMYATGTATVWKNHRDLNTAGYPAGKYRYSVEYRKDGKVLQSADVDFELSPPIEIPPEPKENAPGAFKLQNLKVVGGPYRVGDDVRFSYEIANVSGEAVSVRPPTLGIGQSYIERLGPDPKIAAMPRNIAFVKNRYAANGNGLKVDPVVPKDKTYTYERILETKGYPPGKYRYHVDHKDRDDKVLQTVHVDFSLD